MDSKDQNLVKDASPRAAQEQIADLFDHTMLCYVPTHDQAVAEALAPKLRPFLVDQSVDDDSFLICAPSLDAARAVVVARRRAKLLRGAGPRIVAVPMRPLEGEP